MSAMSSAGPQEQWATPEEWDLHREKISRIYWDENKTLKELAEIMRKEHGFNATQKMYKNRFRRWGLTKYLKADQARQALEDADQGKIAVPFIRGRMTGGRRLRRELYRKLPVEFATLTRPAAASSGVLALPRNPSPLATRIDAPTGLNYAEICLNAVLEYSRIQFQKVAWDRTSEYSVDDYSETWQNKVIASFGLITNGRVKNGFRLIDLCLRNYRTEIATNHPCLLIETYSTIVYLTSKLPDLAETILRYIAGLCHVSLGPYHPYTRLWGALRSLGIEQIRRLAAVVIQAQLNEFETWFDPGAEFLCIQRIDAARQTHCYGSLSLAETEAEFSKAIAARTAKGGPDMIEFACWAKLNQAAVYQSHGDWAKVGATLDEVGLFVDADAEGLNDLTKHEYWGLRCRVASATGTYEEEKAAYRRRLDWDCKVVGPDHHWTTRSIAELDNAFRLQNDVEASAKLHEEFDFESNWAVICKREDEKEVDA